MASTHSYMAAPREQQSRAVPEDVRRVFACLSPQDCEALDLVVSTGLSCESVARSRCITGSTFRSRVQRGRARLIDVLRLEPSEAYGEGDPIRVALQVLG